MPKVSVVVPNYNHSIYLRERLDSIFNQTYQDFEVIVLDDCSTDKSLEVLQQYDLHPKVSHFIKNKRNSGSTFIQWNKGIKQAKGEYIWIAESDDWADSCFLENLVPVLDNNPDVGLVFSQSLIIDENNIILKSFSEWTNNLSETKWNTDYINTGVDEFKNYFVYMSTIPNASAVLFRKNIYIKSGGADERYRYMGDVLVWTKFLLSSNIAFIAKNLNYYRMHTNTVRKSSARITFVIDCYLWVNYVNKKTNIDYSVFEKRLQEYCNDIYYYFKAHNIKFYNWFFIKTCCLAIKTDKNFLSKFLFYLSSDYAFLSFLFKLRKKILKKLRP